MNFFTSDLHFGHANVIEYCNRPFTSVSDMNGELIRRWRQVVSAGDTVYVLGDFSFENKAITADITLIVTGKQIGRAHV